MNVGLTAALRLGCIIQTGPKFYDARLPESIFFAPQTCHQLIVQSNAHPMTEYLASLFPEVFFVGVEVEDSRATLTEKTETMLHLLNPNLNIHVIESNERVRQDSSHDLSQLSWPVLTRVAAPREPSVNDLEIYQDGESSKSFSTSEATRGPAGHLLRTQMHKLVSCSRTCGVVNSKVSAQINQSAYDKELIHNYNQAVLSINNRVASLCNCSDLGYREGGKIQAAEVFDYSSRMRYIRIQSLKRVIQSSDKSSRPPIHGTISCGVEQTGDDCCAELVSTLRDQSISAYFHFDDDTWVNSDGLKRYLEELASYLLEDPVTPVMMGRLFRFEAGPKYASGGAGYLLSRSAIASISNSIIRVRAILDDQKQSAVQSSNTHLESLFPGFDWANEDLFAGYWARLTCGISDMDPFEVAYWKTHQWAERLRGTILPMDTLLCTRLLSGLDSTGLQRFNSYDLPTELGLSDKKHFWSQVVNLHPERISGVNSVISMHYVSRETRATYNSLLTLNS